MRFTIRIAWRYIFSKKSTNAINIISGISMLGIIIGSASLIIILSAFNGFESLVLKLYSSFYPDITITAAEGKVFIPDEELLKQISEIDGVEFISKSLEENALLAYDKQEHIATIKGVDNYFKEVTAVDDSVIIGDYFLTYQSFGKDVECAILGLGIAAMLDVAIGIDYPPVQVFMPRRTTVSSFNPRNTFIQKGIKAAGAFRIQQDFDSKYVITSFEFISELLEYHDGQVSALEIKTENHANVERIRNEIQKITGEKLIVKSRFMQNEFLYKVMRNERWVVYLILTFILIIAAFNMIGSISMLVIDKRKDIAIIRSLGATEKSIRNIFFIQGILQTLVSIFIGFTLATILCLIQMYYGIIAIPGTGSFVVTAYPIDLKLMDYIYIFITIIIIGSIASYLPATLASRQKWMFKEE